MSFSATDWVNATAPAIQHGPRIAVLRCLADHMNQGTGLCCPKIATICRETGFRERCVQKCLRWLERAGLMTTHHRGRRSSQYVLHLGRYPSEPGGPAPNDDQGGSPRAPQTGPDVHPNPAFRVHEVPTEPEEDLNQKKNQEDARAGARPSPSPSPVDEISEAEPASGIEAEPTATVEDDPEPEPEVRQLAIERGFDPAEVPEELRECVSGKRCLIPADWQPSAADRACAVTHGQDPDLLRARFVLHYRAKGAKLADFSAQFQLWCLPDPRYPRRQTLDERITATHDHYAAMAGRMGLLRGDGLSLGSQP